MKYLLMILLVACSTDPKVFPDIKGNWSFSTGQVSASFTISPDGSLLYVQPGAGSFTINGIVYQLTQRGLVNVPVTDGKVTQIDLLGDDATIRLYDMALDKNNSTLSARTITWRVGTQSGSYDKVIIQHN